MPRVSFAKLFSPLFVLLLFDATASSAQTLKLNVFTGGDTPGVVRLTAGATGTCASFSCDFYVEAGATVRLSAVGIQPGRFSSGSGPAAGCSRSTCSFVMTANADITATFTSGDGPVAALTIDWPAMGTASL